MPQPFKNEIFIKENFTDVDLKDARLANRLSMIVKKMIHKPEVSLPSQMEEWKDAKACYRFFRNPRVTHKRIQTPHRERVKRLASKVNKKHEVILFIQDLSELDYSSHKNTKGLGQVGNQYGLGIQMHSCLAIRHNQDTSEVLGLAHQIVWERKKKKLKGKPGIGEQFRALKESGVWSQTLRAIGSPPLRCHWVTVGDRNSDCNDLFCESKKLGWEAVIRACHDRRIKVNNESKKLMVWIRSLSSKGVYTISVRKKGETKKREIQLNVSWERDIILDSSEGSEEEIELSVIRCWNEEESIEWILYSTMKIETLEEAIEKIIWYSKRWIIEEYHKCIKTGCKIETRQLESHKALEALTGVLGIISILMLHLRHLAREASDELAKEHVPEVALKIICSRFKLDDRTLTIYDFWRTVSRMGGFLNRKSDGEPGWQTLWSGWLQLLNMMQGVEAFLNGSKGCYA
jgi:Transposase DNA-binding/Transposase DDE domain